MHLRPYQQEASDAIFDAFNRGVNRPLVVLPTGGGKTVLFSHVIKQRGGRALVLAHRDELLQQAASKILAVIPGARVGLVKGQINQHNADIVVGSVQTLGREKRLARLAKDFDTIVIDEAHHAEASSYKRVLEYFAPSNPLILGVTATPDRGDGKGLDKVFDEIVYEVSILDGIKQGWLSQIEGKLIMLKGADFSHVHSRGGDYKVDELEQIMQASNWAEHVSKAWHEHARDRKAIVFVPKVKMGYELADLMRSQGTRAEAIDGAMEFGARRAALRRLSTGETQVMINCAVLTEGFDEPSIDCVLMARPTKSRGLYVQCVGRGLRLHPGKESCLVLDMVGVSQRHDLVTLASLAGVEKLKENESFTKAKQRAEVEQKEKEQKEKEEAERIAAEHEARRVDLIRRQQERQAREQAQRQRQAARWQQGVDNRWQYETHDTIFTIRPTANGMYVVGSNRGFRAFGDSVEECMDACAPEIVKSQFSDPSARWRNDPASPKQLETLSRFHIRYHEGITKGEAKDLLDGAFARRKAA